MFPCGETMTRASHAVNALRYHAAAASPTTGAGGSRCGQGQVSSRRHVRHVETNEGIEGIEGRRVRWRPESSCLRCFEDMTKCTDLHQLLDPPVHTVRVPVAKH